MSPGSMTFKILGIATGVVLFVVGINSAMANQIYVYERDNGTRLVTDHQRMDPTLRLIKRYSLPGEDAGTQPVRFQIRHGANSVDQSIGETLAVLGAGGQIFRGTGEAVAPAKARPRYRTVTSRYDELIRQTAKNHGVDSALVRAMVQAESAFKPDAVSHAGATGLMQLMPGTAERYGVENRKDPVQNVDGGVRYLRDLLEMFGDNLPLAIAAYNAGENAVIKHRGIPPYKETQHYVRKVMKLHKLYLSES